MEEMEETGVVPVVGEWDTLVLSVGGRVATGEVVVSGVVVVVVVVVLFP